ncbi:MAG: hypothetical protein LBS99_02170 [Clostridiales bacterium]|jgi:hypothetical protein|nr:hypothetical protein [Clostridiales bacterium]
MEVYYEQSVSLDNPQSIAKKMLLLKVFYYAALALGVISVVILLWLVMFSDVGEDGGAIVQNILSALFFLPIPLTLFLAAYLLHRARVKLSAEYDYQINGGRYRIVKVINRQKRKKFLEFSVSSFEVIGKLSSESYERYLRTPGIKKKNAVVNFDDEERIYFAVVNIDGVKTMLHFEPDEETIRSIRLTLGRDIVLKK